MGKKVIIVFLIMFLGVIVNTKTCRSQEEINTPFFYSVAFLSGENKPHRPIIKNLTYPYRGAEFKFGWQSIGKQPWQVAYRYPSYGIGLNMATFQTPILGEPIAAFFFMKFPQLNSKYLNIDLEIDLGTSYGINPYHPIKNPHNFSTGSTVNAFIGFYLEQSLHLSSNIDLFFSQGLTHYSNGAMGYPNLGLNIFPTLKMGIKGHYDYPDKIKHNIKDEFRHNWQLNFYLGGGRKTLFDVTPIYRELVFSPSLYYRLSYKRRIGVAYDVIYNEAITGVWTRQDETGWDLVTQSVLLSHEYLINKFTILSQMGFYTVNLPFDKYKSSRFDIGCIISRFGIGYYFTPYSRVVLNLKAHHVKAEYVEAGLIFDLHLN